MSCEWRRYYIARTSLSSLPQQHLILPASLPVEGTIRTSVASYSKMKESGIAVNTESLSVSTGLVDSEQAAKGIDPSPSGRPSTKNRCTCGSLIVHVKSTEEGRQTTPRHQSVFNRLYRHRVIRERHLRKLAAEQIAKEARECTYIPLTTSVRGEISSTSSSSMGSIAHRERVVEKAREQFQEGKMCVECLKKVEVSTGAVALDDEVRITAVET